MNKITDSISDIFYIGFGLQLQLMVVVQIMMIMVQIMMTVVQMMMVVKTENERGTRGGRTKKGEKRKEPDVVLKTVNRQKMF